MPHKSSGREIRCSSCTSRSKSLNCRHSTKHHTLPFAGTLHIRAGCGHCKCIHCPEEVHHPGPQPSSGGCCPGKSAQSPSLSRTTNGRASDCPCSLACTIHSSSDLLHRKDFHCLGSCCPHACSQSRGACQDCAPAREHKFSR